jgi:hypothetical protein
VGAGGTASLTLTLSAGNANQVPSGGYDGDVTFTCGSTILRIPWFVLISREGKP